VLPSSFFVFSSISGVVEKFPSLGMIRGLPRLLQCVAVCCNVLQCVARCLAPCARLSNCQTRRIIRRLYPVCYSVLPCVAMCCTLLCALCAECVCVLFTLLCRIVHAIRHLFLVCCSLLHAVCDSVLQWVGACCAQPCTVCAELCTLSDIFSFLCCSVVRCVAVLQCVAVCWIVLSLAVHCVQNCAYHQTSLLGVLQCGAV